MAELPRGTVTFLFSDVEGSTRLLTRLRGRYGELLGEHRRLLRAAFDEHHGREVHTEGDGFFVAFARASDAIAAAVSAQRSLACGRWPEGVQLRVRMGVHTGEAEVREHDYVGLDVHRAARICAAGHGGQVLISGSTRELVADELPRDVALKDLGQHRLKDLERPEHLFQLVVGGLPAEFPAPASLAAGSDAANGLPPSPNRTIGRADDVRAIVDRLRGDGVRLLTLTGPGGVGKTRLALELARAAMPRFRDGVAWVELAAVGRAEHVPGTVARALSVTPLAGETPEQALLRVLEAKQLLLAIDNFEHVLEAAPLVARLLAHCATLTVLATSREALDLAAEHVYPVAPLALPTGDARLTAAGIEASPAGALFLAAAERHDPSFRVGDSTARAIAEICRRLDGLPLAIELAAARAPLLSPESLAARLDRALATLASGPRDAPERQRTLRATIDWSYRLLDSGEQAAFARFAVFAGGATLEDAEAITNVDLDTLEGLARKHLLLSTRGPDGEARLLMLETVREYARERLDAADDETEVRSRHCHRYLNLATRATRHLFTHTEPEWLSRLETEIDNIRAVLDWALEFEPQVALRLAGVLGRYWEASRRAHEGERWLRATLEVAGTAAPIGDRARGRIELACMLSIEDRRGDSKASAVHALALARESGDDALIADALVLLSGLAISQNDFREARALAIEGLAHARSAEDQQLIAWAVTARANTLPPGDEADDEYHEAAEELRRLGDRRQLVSLNVNAAYRAIIDGSYADAASLLDEALPLARESKDAWGLLLVWGNLGLVRLFTGEDDGARIAFEEQLRICRDHNIRWPASEGLGGLAAIATRRQHFDRAARLLGAAGTIGPIGHRDVTDRLEQQFIDTARAHLGDRRWSDAVQAGRRLAFREAIELALAAPGTLQHHAAARSSDARSGTSRPRA